MIRKGRTPKETETVRKESHSRFSKSMLTPTCRVLDTEIVRIWWSHSTYNTYKHESPGFFFFPFCNPVELCWDYAPSRWYRSWTESSGMAQCRWQNQSKAADFWEDPPNTENFGCTQNGLLDFYIYEKGFFWCPSESRLRPVSPKRSNCVLHSSKVYLHAHLAFQAPT